MAEERRAYRSYDEIREMGRSRVTVVCPWCDAHVVAYLWSLAGGGKRCTCGVMFTGKGEAVKR